MPFGHKLAHRLALLKGRFGRGALLALGLSFVASCEKPISLSGPNPTVAQLVITPTAVTLQPNQSQDFTAVGFTAAGDTAQIAVTWSATGGTVDTSSAGGRHYGHYQSASCGQYTLTATSKPGNLSASASIAVTCPVATVTISPAAVNLQSGQTTQLTATLKDATGNVLTGRTVTWSSNNGAVAAVSGTGLVTAAAAGTATITAMSEGKSGTASVTVSSTPVASVTVTPPTASLNVGQTVQLTATPRDASGNPLLGRPVTWTTSNGTIASVSSSGLVTGVAAGGPVTITATSGGQSGTATVTVATTPVASVAVTPNPASVTTGLTVQLTATPKDANGNPLTGRTVAWASANTGVATVNGSGLVTGVAVGATTISATSEGQTGTAALTVTAPGSSVVLVGAGDIAECGSDQDDSTAALVARIGGTPFTLGDNAYPDGYYADYANCWAPSWGQFQSIIRPAAGNHEYHDDPSSGAGDYYTYFYRNHGTFVGDSNKYYYSYDMGAWHMVVLNSLDGFIDMSAGSPEEQWLRADLAANTKRCIMAYMHYPRFSSGSVHGSYSAVQPLWQALYDYGADLALAGHDHEYERFAPQTPNGTADPVKGIRSFVVGTGGGGLYSFATPLPNSEVRDASTFGVLKLTLGDGTYSWQFVPITGQTFTDAGSGTCHH